MGGAGILQRPLLDDDANNYHGHQG